MNLEPLDIDRIRRGVAGLAMPFDLIYFSEVDSTNRVAATLPAGSFRPGAGVLTDYQLAGRGRRERTWVAPPRTGLLMSLVFELPPVPGDVLLLMALAVREAIESIGAPATIKWPNDILINGRKVCGILAEYVTRDGSSLAIVGCGINVLSAPEIPGAGSVAGELGRAVNREDLALSILSAVDRRQRTLVEHPDHVFEEWVARLETIGSEIVVSDGSAQWTGKATAVERNGGLRVRLLAGGERTVLAGDVSIRPSGALQPPDTRLQ